MTKPTGKKEYILQRSIRIYGQPKPESGQVLECRDGTVLLMDPQSGNFNVYAAQTELMWLCSRRELLHFLNPPEDK